MHLSIRLLTKLSVVVMVGRKAAEAEPYLKTSNWSCSLPIIQDLW